MHDEIKKSPPGIYSAKREIYARLQLRAREFRQQPTYAEFVLWNILKTQPYGLKFRRQHIIDRFIVDFYCVKTGLVIEVDGDIHDLQKEADQLRTEYLEQLGCTVLRFRNEEVLKRMNDVVRAIGHRVGDE